MARRKPFCALFWRRCAVRSRGDRYCYPRRGRSLLRTRCRRSLDSIYRTDRSQGYATLSTWPGRSPGQDPFLHLVGDHLYAGNKISSSTRRLVEVAVAEGCAVSAVQAYPRNFAPRYGAIGGQPSRQAVYIALQKVVEKPTPTEAEQELEISGLRPALPLLFGSHVLTPTVMEILTNSKCRPLT